jgi:hypothetical protein
MAGEIWSRCRGFSRYDASTQGGVRNHETKQELATRAEASGTRYIVVLNDAGGRKNMTVGALVLLAHVGRPRGNANRAIHGKKGLGCDWLTNLSWGTAADQVKAQKKYNPDGYKAARGRRGEGPRIPDSKAKAILKRVTAGKLSVREAARDAKCSRSTMTNALNRVRNAGAARPHAA